MADPMWMLVMFDLPVVTAPQRKDATRYRKGLQDLGFEMIQLSVYAKYMPNATHSQRILNLVKEDIPRGGYVRALRLADSQWAGMKRFEGPELVPMEEKPQQLVLFE